MADQQQQEHPMVPVPDAIRKVLMETARVLITSNAKPNPTVQIPLVDTTPPSTLLHKVLDQDVIMIQPGYPPYNASIMDGYAICSTECNTSDAPNQWTYRVVRKVYAGDDQVHSPCASESSVLPTAYYITTGAVVPDSCDCVVPIEECQVSEDGQQIRIMSHAKVSPNEWIRPIGCDIPPESIVLPKGHKIDPIALGLLKQSGVQSITVKRPLVIGILSTGNELMTSTQQDTDKQQKGKIPDVNRPILLNMIPTFGIDYTVMDLGHQRDDDVHAMAKTMDQALDNCDVIITTGGISMGETDIVERVLIDHCHGTLHFGRMHMKPGKPTTFVTIPKGNAIRLVFAMPGNPVSAIVCTQLLVKPCLDLLYFGPSLDDNSPNPNLDTIVNHAFVHPELSVKLAHDIKLDPQRPEYCRVTIQKSENGSEYQVSTTGIQRSSRLLSCRDAQGLLYLPVGTSSKPKALQGETYTVLLLTNPLRGYDRLQLKDSKHLKKRARESKIAIVQVVPQDKLHLSNLEETSERVKGALSGSKSGNARIVSKKVFSGPLDASFYSTVIDSNGADLVVVSCVSYPGSFSYHLDVSASLKKHLYKQAKSLALQARQGAASEDATAALFEVVVGYAPEEQGAMVICLPDKGLHGGLGNVRGLLKHALNLARDKPHNHHHTHQHHDHISKSHT